MKNFFNRCITKDKEFGKVKPILPVPSYKGDTHPRPFEREIFSEIGNAFFKEKFNIKNEKVKPSEDELYEKMTKAVNETTDIVKQLGITGVSAVQTIDETLYIITVKLERPGIFIGVKGQTIDMVTKNLSDHFKKEVHIRIKEDKDIGSLYDFQRCLSGFFGCDYRA